jgi:hypothetical protein
MAFVSERAGSAWSLEQPSPVRFLLEEAILAALVRGTAERYELQDFELPRLSRMFAGAARRAGARAELYRVLQLAVALEETLESPTAAARIRTLAQEAPDVLEELRKRLGTAKAMDETRRFLRSEGRDVVLRAPPPPGPWKKRLQERRGS